MSADAIPLNQTNKNFWSAQHPNWPPFPANPDSLPVWNLGDANYLLNDHSVEYAPPVSLSPMRMMSSMSFSGPPSPGGGSGITPSYSPPPTNSLTTNDLWLYLTNIYFPGHYADLLLSNTLPGTNYQIMSKTNLLEPYWTLGNITNGEAGNNKTAFYKVPIDTNQMMFFKARTRIPVVGITLNTNNGYGGIGFDPEGPPTTREKSILFTLTRLDGADIAPLTVYLSLGIGQVQSEQFPAGEASHDFNYADFANTFPQSSHITTMTIVPTNSYFVDGDTPYAYGTNYHSSTTVTLVTGYDGTRPHVGITNSGSVGTAFLTRYDQRGFYPAMPAYYTISGTASNGVDYTNLTGVITFADGSLSTTIYVQPRTNTAGAGDVTATFTLVETNGYYSDASYNTANVAIHDDPCLVPSVVAISTGSDAVEPHIGNTNSGTTGNFTITRTENVGDLKVYYTVSGTASSGVDFTAIANYTTVSNGLYSTDVLIHPLPDYLIEGDETVVLTLVSNACYVVDTNSYKATNYIVDDPDMLEVVAEVNSPIGIDYSPTLNSLVISYNYETRGLPNFLTMFAVTNVSGGVTNITVGTNTFSGITNLGDEIKLTTVKTSAGGFTAGDVYFSSGTNIGWISADGTQSNLNWCTLTNAAFTNQLPVRGGMYVDQTGVFSNQLVAVTSFGAMDPSIKGVWRIAHGITNGIPSLIGTINTAHLEGVITLPNTNKYGPWAGKIISGDEDDRAIYSIASNGMTNRFETTNFIPVGVRPEQFYAISPEDFDLIPSNQSLYVCSGYASGLYKISKLDARYLTNFIGDLLVTDSGEFSFPTDDAILNILHWDSAQNIFITHNIRLGTFRSRSRIEHVTFAPINLPSTY